MTIATTHPESIRSKTAEYNFTCSLLDTPAVCVCVCVCARARARACVCSTARRLHQQQSSKPPSRHAYYSTRIFSLAANSTVFTSGPQALSRVSTQSLAQTMSLQDPVNIKPLLSDFPTNTLQENYKFLSSQTMNPPNTKQVVCFVLGLVATSD
jgi:hypothetical protein